MGKDLGQVAKGIPIIGPIIAGIDANNAATNAQNAQGSNLQQATGYSNDLASTNWVNPLIQAGESGVRSFQADAGGVPNIGLMVQYLFGENMKNAMQVAANERGNNLRGAIGGLTSTGSQYGRIGENAAGAASNAATQEGSQIGSVFGRFPTPSPGGNTGTATGAGSSGKDASQGGSAGLWGDSSTPAYGYGLWGT